MPTIPNRFEFEPNQNALNLWLFTRKGEQQYGMTSPPGFYVTKDFGKDQFWFMLAMFLELVGVSLLIANGLSLGDSLFAMIAIIGAIAMFAIDLFLAYKLHRKHGRKCYGRNRLKVIDDNREIARIQDAMKGGKVVNFFIVFAMILIALVKLAGIVLLGSFDHLAIVIALIIMFGIIVYVHVYHTGFYLYEVLTDRAFQKQFKRYNAITAQSEHLNRPLQAETRVATFYENEDLLGFDKEGNPRSEIMANRHKLSKVPGKERNGKQAFQLETTGILIDEDIATFLGQGGLDGGQKTVIARTCLEHQTKIHMGEI